MYRHKGGAAGVTNAQTKLYKTVYIAPHTEALNSGAPAPGTIYIVCRNVPAKIELKFNKQADKSGPISVLTRSNFIPDIYTADRYPTSKA